jgi:hypothetical protein
MRAKSRSKVAVMQCVWTAGTSIDSMTVAVPHGSFPRATSELSIKCGLVPQSLSRQIGASDFSRRLPLQEMPSDLSGWGGSLLPSIEQQNSIFSVGKRVIDPPSKEGGRGRGRERAEKSQNLGQKGIVSQHCRGKTDSRPRAHCPELISRKRHHTAWAVLHAKILDGDGNNYGSSGAKKKKHLVVLFFDGASTTGRGVARGPM